MRVEALTNKGAHNEVGAVRTRVDAVRQLTSITGTTTDAIRRDRRSADGGPHSFVRDAAHIPERDGGVRYRSRAPGRPKMLVPRIKRRAARMMRAVNGTNDP
ncbi:MAG: hypothetical protein C0483_13720 [Pirellula sp.]|nr:hypothetical protein [Pirellula sp.]